MAYTQTQIDTLEAAIAEGVLEVEYGDKKVKYRSLNEMIRILAMMKQSQTGRTLAERRTVGVNYKGL